jgi:hypothetical protein
MSISALQPYMEKFAIRLGVRTLEFTGICGIAGLAVPYVEAWLTSKGVHLPNDLLSRSELVSLFASSTALCEATFRRHAQPLLPTFTEVGFDRPNSLPR